jgi:hypothetical protein
MKRSLFVSGLLALAASFSLHAITLTFTDRADWSAQVTNLTNFNGGSLNPGQSQNYGTSAGLIVTDLQIVGLSGAAANPWYDLVQVNAGPAQTYYDWGSGTIIRSSDKTLTNSVSIRLNFTTPVSAFGFNYGAGGGGDAALTIVTPGLTSTNTQALARPNFRFFGVASDTLTFSTVQIFLNTTDRYFVIDDIARGTYASTPPPPPPPPPVETVEPGTLLQLALGSGLMAIARQRLGGNA